jgi:hypothetical protein
MTISVRDRSRGGSGDSGPARARAIGGSPRILYPTFNRASAGPALKRGKISQSAIDVAALVSGALFGFVTAAAFVTSLFILFFVRT